MARCRLRLQALLRNLCLSLCYFGFAASLQAAKMEQGCLFHLSEDGAITYNDPLTNPPKAPAAQSAPQSFREFIRLYNAQSEAKENLDLAEKELARLEKSDGSSAAIQKLKVDAAKRVEELRAKWVQAKAENDAFHEENSAAIKERDTREATNPPSARSSGPQRTTPPPPTPRRQEPAPSRRRGPWIPFIERSLPNGDRD